MDAGTMPTNDYKYDPHMNFWNVRGKPYRGLLAILKDRISVDVLGRDNNDGTFIKWWAANVEPHVKTAIADFRNEFRKVITEKYLPALRKPERAVYNGRSFALGAKNSMLDELKLNMAILRRVHNAGRAPTDKASGHDSVMPIVNNVIMRFEKGLRYVGTIDELKSVLIDEAKTPIRVQGGTYYTDPKKPVTYSSAVAVESYARNAEQLKMGIEILDKVMSDPSKKLAPEAVKTVNGVREAAIVNLKNLVTELDSYNGMLLSLRIEGIQ